jgi:hypothetical protein
MMQGSTIAILEDDPDRTRAMSECLCSRFPAYTVLAFGNAPGIIDYLATQNPCCPVIIHTTNSLAAPGMVMAMEDSGWASSRVVPYDDLKWVWAEWIVRVAEGLARREAN